MKRIDVLRRLVTFGLGAAFCTGIGTAQVLSSPNLLPARPENPEEFGTKDQVATTITALAFVPADSGLAFHTSGSLGRYGALNTDTHFYAALDIPRGAIIDKICVNNLNDETEFRVGFGLLWRNDLGGLTPLASISNSPHASWATDCSSGDLNIHYDIRFALILDVEIAPSPNLQFFGYVTVYWHRTVSSPIGPHFSDVPVTHPFYKFIEALYDAGITAGCSTSPLMYCPERSITRGEMAVYLAVALGLHWPF